MVAGRGLKTVLLCIEVLAFIVAAFAAGAILLFWRIQQGPVSLSAFCGAAEQAIEGRLPVGFEATIGELEVAKLDSDYALYISDLIIKNNNGDESASTETIYFQFSISDFLNGKIGPRYARATGAALTIIRNERQAMDIPIVSERRSPEPIGPMMRVFGRDLFASAFQVAEIHNVRVRFHDVVSGRSWASDDASIDLRREGDGLQGELRGDIDLDGVEANILAKVNYDGLKKQIKLTLDGENFPAGDIMTTFFGANANILEASVTGQADLTLSDRGEVIAARFDAGVGEGFLTYNGVRSPINSAEWRTTFNPAEDVFEIEKITYDIAGNTGLISGRVSLGEREDIRHIEQIDFELTAYDLMFNFPALLEAPLPIKKWSLDGALAPGAMRLDLHDINVVLFDSTASGALNVAYGQRDGDGRKLSPGIQGELVVDGELELEELLAIWPIGPALGARDWVSDRMPMANVSNISAKFGLDVGAIDETGAIPDEAIHVEFDVSGAKANIIRQMTPVTRGRGRGILRGNSFSMQVDSARIGNVAISDGEIDFPYFLPKWQDTFIRFKATGRTVDILSFLDQEPLRLLNKIDISPEQFDGEGVANVEIVRPNKRDVATEEYKYFGKAKFKNMRVTGFSGDADLLDVSGDIDLKPRSLTVAGQGDLADAPLNFVWRQNFFRTDGPSSLAIDGVLDAAVGDMFGLSLRQYLRGPVQVNATATGDIGAFSNLEIDADFSNAAISITPFGWNKPALVPALGRVRISFDDGNAIFDEFKLKSVGADLSGTMTLTNNGLQRATFSKFYLEDAADLELNIERRDNDELSFEALGSLLNLSPVLEAGLAPGNETQTDAGEGDFWGRGMRLTARIDEVQLRNGVTAGDAFLDLYRDDKSMRVLEFFAMDSDGEPIKILLGESDDAGVRNLTVTSSNIGDLYSGLLGAQTIEGGSGKFKMTLHEDAPNIRGSFEAGNLHIANAPLLARIFSAGSLDGLSNLLNGEGIDLTYAFGRFEYQDSILSLSDFRSTGPSIGMTAQGQVGLFSRDAIEISGSLAPAYQLNSALGNTPIIGDILVGRRGEGVVAVSYALSGARTAPDVLVNPLSALTPGIFRQLFAPVLPSNGLSANDDEAGEDGAAAQTDLEEVSQSAQ